MVHMKHTDKPPHCVSPRPQSGFTREYIHGPLVPMDETENPARGIAIGLAIVIPFWALVGLLVL